MICMSKPQIKPSYIVIVNQLGKLLTIPSSSSKPNISIWTAMLPVRNFRASSSIYCQFVPLSNPLTSLFSTFAWTIFFYLRENIIKSFLCSKIKFVSKILSKISLTNTIFKQIQNYTITTITFLNVILYSFQLNLDHYNHLYSTYTISRDIIITFM